MKNINKTFALLFIFSAALLVSCEDEEGYADPLVIENELKDLSGDWFIVGYFDDGSVAYGGDYNRYTTSNTSANDETLWVDDHGAFFEIKTKVTASISNMTFVGEANAEEFITGGTVTVSNGKIIKDGGTSFGTETVVDSIYFEAEFDWDPGTTYLFGGHKRTGFLEDESPHIQ